MVAVRAREHGHRHSRALERRWASAPDGELPVERQDRPSMDPVASGPKRDGAPVGDDDEARLNRPVDRVRVVAYIEAGGTTHKSASGRKLERAASIRKGDRMRHCVLVDPERVHPGPESLNGWRWTARGQEDQDARKRRSTRRKGQHRQHPEESDLPDQPPAPHHYLSTVAP